MRIEVLMLMLVFWVVAPYGLVGRYQHFREHTVPIFRAEDGDSMFSETVSTYKSIWCSFPED
jgi:hypothetical protein